MVLGAGCLALERAVSPGREIAFSLRAPSSSLDEFAARTGRAPPSAAESAREDYRVAEERFRIHVPEECRRRPGCGLLVWLSASDSGHLPRAYAAVVARGRLAVVGADGAGDARPLAARVNLALDAAWNVLRLLPVDPERIYAVGFAGAAEPAGLAARLYPELFAGAVVDPSPARPTADELARALARLDASASARISAPWSGGRRR